LKARSSAEPRWNIRQLRLRSAQDHLCHRLRCPCTRHPPDRLTPQERSPSTTPHSGRSRRQ
jgi:hypothetical protein